MKEAILFALMLVVGLICFMTTWDDEEKEEIDNER